jgi:hypothetical protein
MHRFFPSRLTVVSVEARCRRRAFSTDTVRGHGDAPRAEFARARYVRLRLRRCGLLRSVPCVPSLVLLQRRWGNDPELRSERSERSCRARVLREKTDMTERWRGPCVRRHGVLRSYWIVARVGLRMISRRVVSTMSAITRLWVRPLRMLMRFEMRASRAAVRVILRR